MKKTVLFSALACALTFSCSTTKKASDSTANILPVGVYYDYMRYHGMPECDTLSDSAYFSQIQERFYAVHKNWRRPTIGPRFELLGDDGKIWTSDMLRGRILVLNYWSTGCGPCVKEIPWLCALRDSFPEVNFLGVTIEGKHDWAKMFHERGFKWPHVVLDSTLTDWLPRESHYPATVVIDQKGYVRAFVVGGSARHHSRISDSLRKVVKEGPLEKPLDYRNLHYMEEYYNPK